MNSQTVLTVCLNGAVDVPYGAAGKVSNAARVLAGLGRQVVATGFASGHAGQFMREELSRLGVQTDFESVAGDTAGQTLTEIREEGPTITADDLERFLWRYRKLLAKTGLVIMSGTLPPGVPDSIYADLVGEAWRMNQVRTIVDAAGAALDEALKATPYLVKPNLDELEQWIGTKLPHDRAILAAARQMNEAGAMVVAVSLGARGLLLVAPEGAWRAVPPSVEAVNTIGSGDSLVAGLAAGLLQELPAEEVLRQAVACGTANALTHGVADVRPEDVERLKGQVRVERIG